VPFYIAALHSLNKNPTLLISNTGITACHIRESNASKAFARVYRFIALPKLLQLPRGTSSHVELTLDPQQLLNEVCQVSHAALEGGGGERGW